MKGLFAQIGSGAKRKPTAEDVDEEDGEPDKVGLRQELSSKDAVGRVEQIEYEEDAKSEESYYDS